MSTEAILDGPAHTAAHIAGHWDEVLATAMTVVRSVRPVAIVWVEEKHGALGGGGLGLDQQQQQLLGGGGGAGVGMGMVDDHIHEPVVASVHALVRILRAQREVGFGGPSPPRKQHAAYRQQHGFFRGSGGGFGDHDRPVISPGHTVASVLASVKAPPKPKALEVRYLAR